MVVYPRMDGGIEPNKNHKRIMRRESPDAKQMTTPKHDTYGVTEHMKHGTVGTYANVCWCKVVRAHSTKLELVWKHTIVCILCLRECMRFDMK